MRYAHDYSQSKIDCDTLALGTIREINFENTDDQSTYHTPLGEKGEKADTWYIVETISKQANRCMQRAHLPYQHQQESYIRYKHDSIWYPWKKIATATPPQEYDLPLAEGMSGTCKYSKTQEDLVIVTFSIDVDENTTCADNTLIGTLPAGFRLSPTRYFSVSVQQTNTRFSALLSVNAFGNIYYIGSAKTATPFRIYGEAVFVATA